LSGRAKIDVYVFRIALLLYMEAEQAKEGNIEEPIERGASSMEGSEGEARVCASADFSA